MGPVPSVYGRACMRAGVWRGRDALAIAPLDALRLRSPPLPKPSTPPRRVDSRPDPLAASTRGKMPDRDQQRAIPGTWGLFGAKGYGIGTASTTTTCSQLQA